MELFENADGGDHGYVCMCGHVLSCISGSE